MQTLEQYPKEMIRKLANKREAIMLFTWVTKITKEHNYKKKNLKTKKTKNLSKFEQMGSGIMKNRYLL